MPVWDGPMRLFHWILVLVFASCCITAWGGLPGAHGVSGYALLALLLFRLAWGFLGGDTARFRQLLWSPGAVLREAGRFGDRSRDTRVGHGPIGGWLALLMLLLLAAQAATGVAASRRGAEALGWHRNLAAVLLGVVALHVVVIFAYAVFRGHDLVRPMITGKKRLPAATPAPGVTSPIVALVVMVVVALAVWVFATRL